MNPYLVIVLVVAALILIGWAALRVKTRPFNQPALAQVEGQPRVSYATWLDQGQPWASFTLEEIQLNLDVSEYIQARGK
jgi:hypothetical protein